MKEYVAEIKEVGNPSILTPSIQCEEMTKEDLIRFFGLDEPDVEWFKVYQKINGEKVELTP